MKKFCINILVCVALLLPVAMYAEDGKPKGALDYSLSQYGFTLAVALLGGLVSWYTKVRKGEIPGWGIFQLTGELLTSALAGLICFWLCEWANAPQLLTAALVGISGHGGTRAIGAFEAWASSKYDPRGKYTPTRPAELTPNPPAAPAPKKD